MAASLDLEGALTDHTPTHGAHETARRIVRRDLVAATGVGVGGTYRRNAELWSDSLSALSRWSLDPYGPIYLPRRCV